MAKPTDNEDKNPNNMVKKQLSLDSNTMLLLNNVVMIIVIVISMIVMYSLLNASFTKKIAKLAPVEETTSEGEEADETKEEGVLLDLGDFIVNLADVAHRRYLKAGVAIELSKTEEEIALADTPSKAGHGETPASPEEAITAEMERYKPAIRDAIISVLSNKTSEELSTPTGKEVAKEEILEMVNNIFEGQREVMRVSFGQFIIQ